MSFGQMIREIWQGATEDAKQKVNQISHGSQEISMEPLEGEQPAKQIALGFAHIQQHFSDCVIDKPILNEPLPESGDPKLNSKTE